MPNADPVKAKLEAALRKADEILALVKESQGDAK
jgi:hypothetical protein